jgi:hypothetical protein
MSAHVRVNGKMADAGGEPRCMSQPSGGKSEALQLEKTNQAHRTEITSCYELCGAETPLSVSGVEAISEGAY